jgi:hypothetical protein
LPTYYDPGDKTLDALNRVMRVDGFPTAVLLDRRGTIRAVWIGYMPGMETNIERLIDATLQTK